MTAGDLQADAAAPVVLGRSEACRQLEDLLDAARVGRGASVVLEGDAGIGKTTLATWLAARASAAGVTVGWARCDADEAAHSLRPWQRLGQSLGPARPSLSALDALLPETEPAGGGGDDDDARALLVSSWRDAWLGAADGDPLLLVLDDIHWSDVGSMMVLAQMASRIEGLPVLFVVTLRTGEPLDAPLARELDRVRRWATVVSLPGLPRDAVSKLIDESGLDGDAGLIDVVMDRTASNPFFVTELLRVRAVDDLAAGRPVDEQSGRQ